jgi:outer membrane protein assembly factor BamD
MPISGRFSARSVRAAILVLALGTAMGGCSLLGLDKDDASNDLNKDAAQYTERPVEQIYADAWNQINRNNWEEAAKQFNEVDRQHPYSVWARRAHTE